MKIDLNEELENTPTENNSANGDESGNAEGGSSSTNGNRADSTQDYSQILMPVITDADIAEIRAMSKYQKDKLRKQINFSDPCKIFKCVEGKTDEIVCPFCGNGTGNDATGIKPTLTASGWLYYCFKCHEFSGDLIKIIATANHLKTGAGTKDFSRILAIGKKILSNAYAGKYENIQLKFNGTPQTKEHSKEELELIATDITDAMKSVELIPIDERRGLTIDTLKRVHAGFIPKWIHPKKRIDGESTVPPTPRIIFPSSPNGYHYMASLILAERTHTDKAYWKMHAGTKETYFLPGRKNQVIVLEGEVDGLSIWQATEYNIAIAIVGGVDGKKLIGELNRIFTDKEQRLNFQPLILFDNDDTGIKKSRELQQLLFAEGYPAFVGFIGEVGAEKVDANDILRQHGGAKLKARIEEIFAAAKVELSGLQDKVKNFQDAENAEKEKDGNTSSKVLTDSDIADAAELIQSLTDSDEPLTIKTVYDNDNLKAAAIVKKSDIGLFEQFKQKIKDSKIRVGNFDERVNNFVSEFNTADFKKSLDENAAQMEGVFKEIFKDSRDISLPPNYSMSINGLSKIVMVKDGTAEVQIATAPIYISNFYYISRTKFEKSFFADIATLRKGRLVKIRQVDEGVLFDAKRITALISEGLPITSNDAKDIVTYLSDFRARNQYNLDVKPLFEKLGWQHLTANSFVFVEPYSGKYTVAKNNTLAGHLYTKGDSVKWLSLVKKVFDESPIGQFIISAALASLLIEVIGCRPFVVYLRCKSRAGKSAVFKLAASIFGDTNILKSFSATNNALEGAIINISPFPFLCDERQVAGANFDVNNFVYRAGLGLQRGRCNTDGTLKDTKIWHNVTICNGEEKLTESAKTQGLHTRTLELDFQGDKIISDELATKIHIMFDTSSNFGHGGKIFLETIQAENLDELKESYCLIDDTLKENHPQYIDDHRRYIAAVTVANILVQKFFWNVDADAAFDSALANAAQIFQFIDTQINLSDEEREKEFITGWLAENRLHFIGGIFNEGEKLANPIFGEFKDQAFYVNTKSFREAVERAGMSYHKVRDDLISAGVIVKDGNSDTFRRRYSGVQCRALKIIDVIGDNTRY